MSDDTFGSDDTGQQETDGSALRKFGTEQKRRADELDKQLAELRAELAKRNSSEIFAKLNVPEKVRKFYTGEPTQDAIEAWVKENADVFGLGSEAEQDPERQQQNADLEAVTQATLTGQDRPSALSRESMAQMNKDLFSKGASLEELLKHMNVPDVAIQGPMM